MTTAADTKGGSRDGEIPGAYNPITKKNDLAVIVPGDRLTVLHRKNLTFLLRSAELIPDAVKNPDSVFESDEGEWIFYKTQPTQNRTLFAVRVRPTGGRVVNWQFEDPDPYNPAIPRDRGADRIKARLK